jgi:Mn2+/Fe2+ NRAMP family transporter
MLGWAGSLDARPHDACTFYATIAVATLLGAALNFIGLDPVRSLYWAAVINGVLAAPLMAVMMLIVHNPRVMGRLTLSWSLTLWGWAATAVMAEASLAFFILTAMQ